jgi:hypothetical protein
MRLSIISFLIFGCAANSTLREENIKLRQRLHREEAELGYLRRLQELESALKKPSDFRGSQGAPVNLLTPPADVGFVSRPPVGWGEQGNRGRSVELKNTSRPDSEYWLRVWIDNQEVIFTPGQGVYISLIQTSNGPKPVSLLRPNGHSYHLVDVGQHDLLWERYLGYGANLQYVETCEIHGVDFDKNTYPRGVFRFGSGKCSRRAPSD